MQTHLAGALSPYLSEALSVLLVEAQRSLQKNPTSAEICISRAVDLLARIARPDTSDGTLPSGGLLPWRMHRVRKLIEERIDEQLSSSDLAAAVGLSPSQFARAFKLSFGTTPHQYLMRARIDRTKMLMLTSLDALSDIALACGLADQSHFSRLFHKLEGETPAAWRRRQSCQSGGTLP
ncbi:MAG TPA: AraC family transcriptional regulator [Hyphomonadaceae bacterium]|nr:AraC family transcriptional regulator [Hyphomonadaceae bacterium]HPI48588.1 AraC family transcriptional regulator [Hyphomonadaceae bacterium]